MTGWLKPSDFKYSFEERKYSTVYFTPQRFERLKTALSLFIIPLTVLLVFLWKHTKKLVTKTELFLKFIKDQFRLTIGSFKKSHLKKSTFLHILFGDFINPAYKSQNA